MNWFAKNIAKHPWNILIGLSILCSITLHISLTYNDFPSFEDPQLGFETRGTEISRRLTAWGRLMDESQPSGSLVTNPNDFQKIEITTTDGPLKVYQSIQYDDEEEEESCKKHAKNTGKNIWQKIKEIERPSRKPPSEKVVEKLLRYNFNVKFFCDAPSIDYSHLIIASSNGEDLLTYESVMKICDFQQKIESSSYFTQSCLQETTSSCCRMWSLPNYIAYLRKVPSCKNISRNNLNNTIHLINMCARYYHLGILNPEDKKNPGVPRECVKDDVVYFLMHFVFEASLIPYGHMSVGKLLNTAIFLPISKSSANVKLYHELEHLSSSSNDIKIVAMDLGAKYSLFDEYLVRDTRLLLFTSVFIIVCIWLYTGSLLITILTILSIFFSLVVAYYIYTFIFRLEFFPFMNILAVIVAIGIGSDDTYIICTVWDRTMKENSHVDKTRLVYLVMKHSIVAVFVTTLTTVAAFLSSFGSYVTAVRCFSIFAGLSVLMNFLFMILWVLPGIVITSNWPYIPMVHFRFQGGAERIYKNISIIKSSFDGFVSHIIHEYHIYCIAILGFFSILSMISVLYWPKLQVPDSAEFQLFEINHPFEQYDLVYKHKFWFNRIFVDDDTKETLPLRFVWGVLPKDTGNYLDPLSRGKLHLDPTFDIASNTSQEWLLNFCSNLRKQPFYRNIPGLALSNCFLEIFKEWMKQKCIDTIDNTDRRPCCEDTAFPYPRKVFNMCIIRGMKSLYQTPAEYIISDVAGPRFPKKPINPKAPTMKALVVEFESTMPYSTSFEAMDTFHNQVDSWSKEQFSKAPIGMKNGWYVSHLGFYDLQRVLCQDTGMSVFISMMIALSVLFLVTLNISLSLYAILAITCIIFNSIAILILLGWKLNVLESIAISVAIGLSVDFSLHYVVNYKLCPDKYSRKIAVDHSISMMAGPSIMAAITTGASGLFMLPSIILPYIQIGIFLLVVSAVSWIYSTFFLMCLLHIIGPENEQGQFSYWKNIWEYLVKFFRRFFSRGGERSAGKSIGMRFKVENNIYTIEEMQTLKHDDVPNKMPGQYLPNDSPTHIEEMDNCSSVGFVDNSNEYVQIPLREV